MTAACVPGAGRKGKTLAAALAADKEHPAEGWPDVALVEDKT